MDWTVDLHVEVDSPVEKDGFGGRTESSSLAMGAKPNRVRREQSFDPTSHDFKVVGQLSRDRLMVDSRWRPAGIFAAG